MLGIIGLGKAIEIAYNNFDEYNKKLTSLRDYYIEQVENKIKNIKLNGHRTLRLPGNANISFPDIEGEKLLIMLDEYGICASSGSACTSGLSNPSHVLLALGLENKLSKGALRITIGDDNTKDDIDFLVKKLVELVNKNE